MDGPPPQRWDRTKWITVFSSHSPTIREVTECLGLGLSPSASTTNRGIPKFDAPEFKKLSSEVTRLSKELPQDRETLLDYAADPHALDPELDKLLAALGPPIWGKDADRSRLVTPDASKKTYYKDLFYEDPEDRDILKIHLQRWIVIKACYYIRNRKLKKHSLEGDLEAFADGLDGGSPLGQHKPELLVKLPVPVDPKLREALSPPQSPLVTPQSLTPLGSEGSPPNGGAVKPVNSVNASFNDRKRKSPGPGSFSDGDDHSVDLPRKRSYQSATLPFGRKSPRKPSFTGRTMSAENIPPQHIQPHHAHSQSRSPTQSHGLLPHHNGSMASAGPESGRPLLGTLSHSALNGPRPATSSPSTFAAVNAPSAPSGFTAVNAPGAPSGTNVAIAPHPRPYSSPYDPDARSPPEPHKRHLTNGHSEPPHHHKQLVPRETRDPSPHKTPDVRHASPHVSHSHLVGHGPQHSNGFTPVGAPNNHVNHHAYHSHSIPPQQPPHLAPQPPQQPQHQSSVYMKDQPREQLTFQPKADPREQAPAHPPPQGPAGLTNFQPAFSAHHGPGPNGVGTRIASAPVLPSNAPHIPVANGHPPAHMSEQRPSRAPSPADTTMMQCELLSMLMKYFFSPVNRGFEESQLLHNLELIWIRNEAPFKRTLGALYDNYSRVLFAWMEERRKITALAYSMQSQPGVREAEMVDRLLAMNDLRVMRLKWKKMTTNDEKSGTVLSAEDLLCRAFAALTKTEGTEHLFKEGLARLNDDVFEFLRSEDMKISMLKR